MTIHTLPFIPKSFGTHDGTFHADDVTACALLCICDLVDKDKIFRTRDPECLQRCEYVCDVGGFYLPEKKRFDHHQIDYKGSLSSAGMILEYLKNAKFLPQKETDFLNNSLVRGIDAHDNGKDPQLQGYCFFSHVISNFAPIEYDAKPEEQDSAFSSAVEFTIQHLTRLLNRFRYTQACKNDVQKAMATFRDCLIFERPIPWIDSFFELGGERHPAKFVVMPTGDHWKLRGIPPSGDERMKVRHPLPESWAGLMDVALQKITGIPGALFCHKGRFISVWKTREDALEALRLVFGSTRR
jgi:uncharacterized UPF0160 family protein